MATFPFLPPDTLEKLNGALGQLDEADKAIELAIRAGVDMTDQRQRSAENRAKLNRMKQTFYPGQF
jgi:hypothetical protein